MVAQGSGVVQAGLARRWTGAAVQKVAERTQFAAGVLMAQGSGLLRAALVGDGLGRQRGKLRNEPNSRLVC